MNKISVVLITMNEERNIGRCLDSVMPIADEVVVVDSLSTDATEEICARYHVRFVSHAWEGYTGSKNFADSLASHDLILSIDGEEVLSETLIESIKALTPRCVSGEKDLPNGKASSMSGSSTKRSPRSPF